MNFYILYVLPLNILSDATGAYTVSADQSGGQMQDHFYTFYGGGGVNNTTVSAALFIRGLIFSLVPFSIQPESIYVVFMQIIKHLRAYYERWE